LLNLEIKGFMGEVLVGVLNPAQKGNKSVT
jgi:hypothetical protein